MAITVKQFRWYGDIGAIREQNYPKNVINKTNLRSGSIFFKGNPGVITMLGIQATPGTKFYLNNAEQSTIIGSVGNYQLDLTGIGEITSIRFDIDSLEDIEAANNSAGTHLGTAHIIVDAIYESGD